MPDQFEFNIPRTATDPLPLVLKVGQVIYLLGANGTGKSSLISKMLKGHHVNAKRISAHRQTWFASNTLDMTPLSRDQIETNIRNNDAQENARHRLDHGAERASLAIYDLIDSDTMLARKIAELVRADNIDAAKTEARSPAPLQVINELMLLSNIPIEIALEERQKVVARKNGSDPYSVAELSDGERNAFLIAADVLTAKAGTLIIIDEPERHLHRAIISPLLKQLFAKRKDCAFVVSTHEVMLPLDTPEAATLLVRTCQYNGRQVQSWSIDVLPSGAPIDDELKQDLLGARRRVIFVEGTASSLDAPLYSLVFPQVSVIPKDNCRDVEQATKGVRGAKDMHWVEAWGIIDRDQRTDEDVAKLRSDGVRALSHYSVEALYYHKAAVERLAGRIETLLGADKGVVVAVAIAEAIKAVGANREHLVAHSVLRSARRDLQGGLPTLGEIKKGAPIKVDVDIPSLRAAEEMRFDALIAEADWDGLLTRYPLRESAAFGCIIKALKLTDSRTYREAVLKMLQDDPVALQEVRSLLDGLYEEVSR